MENPIIWINNPLLYKIIDPNDKEITKTKINKEKGEEKEEEKGKEKYNYNYDHDCDYYYEYDESYNDFSIPKPGCGRHRSPSFMKTMFSHS